jgi:hypothetical protein
VLHQRDRGLTACEEERMKHKEEKRAESGLYRRHFTLSIKAPISHVLPV